MISKCYYVPALFPQLFGSAPHILTYTQIEYIQTLYAYYYRVNAYDNKSEDINLFR